MRKRQGEDQGWDSGLITRQVGRLSGKEWCRTTGSKSATKKPRQNRVIESEYSMYRKYVYLGEKEKEKDKRKTIQISVTGYTQQS